MQKLTKQTANAFIETTSKNIKAAKHLLFHHNFDFVLTSVFAGEALETFFGQARQRSGGNLYIDVTDIKAAAEIKNLHALLKYECTPSKVIQPVTCTSIVSIDDGQFDTSMRDTEELIKSNDTLKRKVIYIAGY